MPAKPKTKTSVRTRNVHIPEISRARICIRIVGEEPVLLNRFAAKALTEMLSKSRKIPYDRPPKDPHQEFRDAHYLNVKGQPCIPVMTFKHAMTAAVSLYFSKTDLSTKAAKGAFYVKGQCMVLRFEEETMHIAPVRIGQSGTDVRFRPEYHGWSCDAVIDYDPNMISLNQLLYLARGAGRSIGLCEWRVQKNGNHGTFDIEILPDTQMKRIIKESSPPLEPVELPEWIMKEYSPTELEQLVIDGKNKIEDDKLQRKADAIARRKAAAAKKKAATKKAATTKKKTATKKKVPAKKRKAS